MHLNDLSIFKLASTAGPSVSSVWRIMNQRNGHCQWPINDDLNWMATTLYPRDSGLSVREHRA